MTISVTGGTGLVGSRLLRRFVDAGLDCRALGAVELALTGVMDGSIVNIVDDAPTTLYEMANIVGASIEPSAEPLTNPWMGRMDGSRSRSLGFRPTISTVYQAAQEGIL
jgi:UDP-glucose 4-epimerase